MKSLGRRVLACCLTVPLALSNQVVGYAEDEEVSAVGDYSMTVNAYRASDFLVSIPKSADLSTGTSQYKVKVKGNIAVNDSVIVEPDNSFIMTSDSGQAAVASVTQSKTEWKASELTNDNFVETTGDISCNIDVGTWIGQLHFNIKKGAGTGDSTNVGDYNIQDIYFGDAVITVKDGDTLYIDGVQVTLTDNKYTITDKGTHKVIIISSLGSGITKDIVIAESNINGVSSIKKPNGDYELSFTPDSGKIVESVTVNGSTVDVTANADGSYSFIISSSTDLSNITININVKYDMPEASPDSWFTYSLNDDGDAYTITGIQGDGLSERILSLPNEHQGLPVDTVGSGTSLLQNNTAVREVYFPDTVTTVSNNAFKSSYVQKAAFCDGLQSIGISAFEGCNKLTDINILDSVTSIGASAFKGCTSLPSIHIPNKLTSISNSAFEGCTSLIVTDIPSSVVSIGRFAFKDCNIESVYLDNMNKIGEQAFANCGLKSIVLSNIDNSVAEASRTVAISIDAFVGNTDIHSVGSLSSYADFKFDSSLPELTNHLFGDNNHITSVEFPDDMLYVPGIVSGSHELTSAVLPSNPECISLSAFNGCSKLTSVNIPKSVTRIDDDAFKDSGLTRVFLNQHTNLTYIGDDAFANCKDLVTIALPDSLTSLGESAFAGSSKITSIKIPSSVRTLRTNAFRDCTSLKYVYILGNTSIESRRYLLGVGYESVYSYSPFRGVSENPRCTVCFKNTNSYDNTSYGDYPFAITDTVDAICKYGVTESQFNKLCATGSLN